jgi:deoxyribose-phosphate aldolase
MHARHINEAQNPDLLLLDPAATAEETRAGCARALTLNLASVVVKPCFVRQAAAALRGSEVLPGTVIGYPYGANAGRIKLYEAKRALTEGAVELLLWGNLGLLKAGDLTAYQNDLTGVTGLAHMNGARVRAALAVDFMSEVEAQTALAQSIRAGADEVVVVYEAEIDREALSGLESLIEAASGQVPVGVMGGVQHPGDLDALRDMGCSRMGVAMKLLDSFLEE